MKTPCGTLHLPLTVSLLIAMTAITLPAQTQRSVLTPTQRLELFDGKTLTGWTTVSKVTNGNTASIWSVSDGAIHCQGKPNGYLRTLQSYRDWAPGRRQAC